MAKPERILEYKIEAMVSLARQVRKEQTNDYYVTKGVGCLLEGYSPNGYRKLRSNQRDRIIWEVLERLDKPYVTTSDRNIWEYKNIERLLESATEMDSESKVIVTGIKVPTLYDNEIVDSIKYTEKLVELSGVCPVFVITGIRDERILDMINKTNITLVNSSGDLRYFLTKLISLVYPQDTRSPKKRHKDLMSELMGSWRTKYIIGCMVGVLEPKVGWALQELRNR